MKLPDFFSKSQPVSGGFWLWFQSNQSLIQEVRTGNEPVMEELAAELRKENPLLQFEMSLSEEGEREFIVSSGGIRDGIPAVESLVTSAPQIPGWRIVAFRQRKPMDSISIGGIEFSPDDVWFKATPHREHVDVHLYIRGFDGRDQLYLHAAFLFLDITLGEYDVMTKIDEIDFLPLPERPAEAELRPIRELAAIVDAI